jgi:hypothetical protein
MYIDDAAEEDDDEDEDEEAEEQRHKKRKRGAAAFIDDAADVADEDEEEDEEDYADGEAWHAVSHHGKLNKLCACVCSLWCNRRVQAIIHSIVYFIYMD